MTSSETSPPVGWGEEVWVLPGGPLVRMECSTVSSERRGASGSDSTRADTSGRMLP